MALKKSCQAGLLITCLIGLLPTYAQQANPFGQTIEINTNLRAIVGKPSWLVIVRNVETGNVLPSIFDFRNENNFWLVLTFSRFYRVTVSRLQFDNDVAINNFCNLEGGILSQESMTVALSGILSPDPTSSRCIVSKFKPYSFTIVDSSADDNKTESAPAASDNPLSAILPGEP